MVDLQEAEEVIITDTPVRKEIAVPDSEGESSSSEASEGEVSSDGEVSGEELQIEAVAEEEQIDYPCTVCDDEVGDEEDAINCDKCKGWCHYTCCNVQRQKYEQMKEKNLRWKCPPCKSKRVYTSRIFSRRKPPDKK